MGRKCATCVGVPPAAAGVSNMLVPGWLIGESNAYADAGLEVGEWYGEPPPGDRTPDERGDARSCGLDDPFCLVRFICRHCSG